MGGWFNGRMTSRKWRPLRDAGDVPATLADCFGDGADANEDGDDWTNVWKVDTPGEQTGSRSDTEEDCRSGVSWLEDLVAGGRTGPVLAAEAKCCKTLDADVLSP